MYIVNVLYFFTLPVCALIMMVSSLKKKNCEIVLWYVGDQCMLHIVSILIFNKRGIES